MANLNESRQSPPPLELDKGKLGLRFAIIQGVKFIRAWFASYFDSFATDINRILRLLEILQDSKCFEM